MISGFQVKYQVGGGAEEDAAAWQRMTVAFERAGDEVSDFGRYVFPKLVPVFEAEVAGQFGASGRGPNSGAWAQLSEQYERWKSANYPGKPILERTGALKAALTESGSPFAMRHIDTNEFDFGTTGVPYASFHQTGTMHMPDRPPLDLTQDFERNLQAAALDGVREAMASSGASEFLSEGGA